MELYNTEARKLDKFIYDYLQPTKTFLGQVRRAIDTICTFLKENCFKDDPWSRTRVEKVVKGGSSGKGTALKGGSDADLVVFLSTFKDYTDQERERKKIICEIERRLTQCQEEKDFEVLIQRYKWENPRVLSFTLCSRSLKESIEFDVLPAYNALGQYDGTKPDPEVYIRLIDNCERPGEFSTCFTELQKDFISRCPTKVKSLIRLVKHWYKEYIYPYKSQLPSLGGGSLPPKYALELLAVYAWEHGSGNESFDMAEAFRTVLWLIQHYKELCIFWTRYYDFEDETLGQYLRGQLQKPRPVILDPADPTGILGAKSRWDLLAQEAERCSRQRCCIHFNGYQISPWKVPLQAPREEPPSFVTAARDLTFYQGYREARVAQPITLQAPREEEKSYCVLL